MRLHASMGLGRAIAASPYAVHALGFCFLAVALVFLYGRGKPEDEAEAAMPKAFLQAFLFAAAAAVFSSLSIGKEALLASRLGSMRFLAASGAGAMAGVFFCAGYWRWLWRWPNWRRARQLRRMPPQAAGAAHPGYGTFAGMGCPLPGQGPCLPFAARVPWLWCRLHAESLAEEYDTESVAPFLLDSGIGRLLVFPQGMQVLLRDEAPHQHLEGRMRYEFHGLQPGPLTVVGEYSAASAGQREALLRQRTGEILDAWKRDPEALRGFAKGADGGFGPEEWEAVRAAARRAAEKSCQEDGAGKLPAVRAAKGRWSLDTDIPPGELAARFQAQALQNAISFGAAALAAAGMLAVALGWRG
jgi:hypothetical protein